MKGYDEGYKDGMEFASSQNGWVFVLLGQDQEASKRAEGSVEYVEGFRAACAEAIVKM